jgi:Ca2+-binding RTX toxin-like protein
MGGSRSLLVTMLLGAAAATFVCTPALGASAGSDFTKLVFEAGDGEVNRVVVTWDGATAGVSDSGIALLLGCVPESFNAVRCLTPSGDPLAAHDSCRACTALIATGDGDDSVRVVGAPPAGLQTRLAGGPGDDTLAGGTGPEAIEGDAGSDTASYADRARPVAVTLDGQADDGARDEGDDVRTEDVTGGAGDDVLTGDDHANELSAGAGGDDRLSGLGGDDTLIGGPGRDTLDGGAGDDTLLSFGNPRGVVDDVRCGAGDDQAQVPRTDRVALDCEHVYFGGTPVPRLAVAGAERIRARRGVLRLVLLAGTEEQAPGARGSGTGERAAVMATASLRALHGTPGGLLARARLGPFGAPGTVALRLKLGPRTRREIARRGAIRMILEISARDPAGNTSLTRRIVVVRR